MYDIQVDIMLFDVNHLTNVRFLVNIKKEDIAVNIKSAMSCCMSWYKLSAWFRPYCVKASGFLSKKFLFVSI